MEYIKTLRFSANHLLTLVNDILDFNKMEAGKIVFEKTEFDLSAMLDDMKRSYSHRTQEKGISFTVEKSADLPVEHGPSAIPSGLTRSCQTCSPMPSSSPPRVASL
ncbi:MAG: hypothetical protein U5L72_01750 [Bacteroidales bacterium]|nr:hypothetical protein [Bacteroidales bacterium]